MKTAQPSGFESVKSIIRRVLADIIIGLPPDKQAEAIDAFAAYGIQITLKVNPFESEATRS